MPSHLAFTVRGLMYPQRQREGRKSLKGHVEMTVGFDLPPVLALVPESIIRGVAETVGPCLLFSPRLVLQRKPSVFFLTGMTGRRFVCDEQRAGAEAGGGADEAGLGRRPGSRFQEVQEGEADRKAHIALNFEKHVHSPVWLYQCITADSSHD
jgi:hypothetical protein|uniref:Uncharacterized protein n=1 Tax=Zea mays TaxID=4577 RepID=A0A804LEB2_MAIZE